MKIKHVRIIANKLRNIHTDKKGNIITDALKIGPGRREALVGAHVDIFDDPNDKSTYKGIITEVLPSKLRGYKGRYKIVAKPLKGHSKWKGERSKGWPMVFEYAA